MVIKASPAKTQNTTMLPQATTTSTMTINTILLLQPPSLPPPLPLQSKIHYFCKMVAILFGKHTSMCNCTLLITSSTLITSSIHKKANYGTYSMTLMVNSGHFQKMAAKCATGRILNASISKIVQNVLIYMCANFGAFRTI